MVERLIARLTPIQNEKGFQSLRNIASSIALLLLSGFAFGQWKYSKEEDGLTLKMVHTAYYSTGRYPYKAVIVRCEEPAELDAYVKFGTYMKDDYFYVKYRVDRSPMEQGYWINSTDGGAGFSQDPAKFAKALVAGSRLTLTGRKFDHSLIKVEADLDGSAKAIIPVLRACGY